MEFGGLDVGVNYKYENIFDDKDESQVFPLVDQTCSSIESRDCNVECLLNHSQLPQNESNSSFPSFESSPLSRSSSLLSSEVLSTVEQELPMSMSSSNVVDEAYFSSRKCRKRTFSTSSFTGLCIHPNLVLDRERHSDLDLSLQDTLPDVDLVEEQIQFEDGFHMIRPDDMLVPLDDTLDNEYLQHQLIKQITGECSSPLECNEGELSLPTSSAACTHDGTQVKNVQAVPGSQKVIIDGMDVQLPTGSIVLAVVDETGMLVPIPGSSTGDPDVDGLDVNDFALHSSVNIESSDHENASTSKAIEADNLKTLLEEFEASSSVAEPDFLVDSPTDDTQSNKHRKSTPKGVSLNVKMVSKKNGMSLIERRNLILKKKMTSAKVKNPSVPVEILNRIKGSHNRRCTKVLSAGAVPKRKQGKAGRGRIAARVRKKNVKQSESGETTDLSPSQLPDHDYCISPQKSRNKSETKTTEKQSFSKLPDYCFSHITDRSENELDNSQGYCNNRKDSGVESGDVSDSSTEVVDRRSSMSDNKGVHLKAKSNVIIKSEDDQNAYSKLPDYIVDPCSTEDSVEIKVEPPDSTTESDAVSIESTPEQKPAVKKKLKLSEYLKRLKDSGIVREKIKIKEEIKVEPVDVSESGSTAEDNSKTTSKPEVDEPEEGEIKEESIEAKKAISVPVKEKRSNAASKKIIVPQPRKKSVAKPPEKPARRPHHKVPTVQSNKPKRPQIIEIDLVDDEEEAASSKTTKTKPQKPVKPSLLDTLPLSKMPTTSLGHSLLYSRMQNQKAPPAAAAASKTTYRRRSSRSYSSSRSRSRGRSSKRRHHRSRSRYSSSGHRKRHRRSTSRHSRRSGSSPASSRSRSRSKRSSSKRRSKSNYSRSSTRSRSRSRSKARSRRRDERWRRSDRSSNRSRRRSNSRPEWEEWSKDHFSESWYVDGYDEEHCYYADGVGDQMFNGGSEERRVLYVGGLEDSVTKSELRARFEKFGPVVDMNIYFRERRDNYGFITFKRAPDAYKALENSKEDPVLSKYNVCFGGRRSFCQVEYSDLDAQDDGYDYYSSASNMDYDSLLQMALRMRR